MKGIKKEILTLIIGILIGAVITVGVFIALKKTADPSEFNGAPQSGFNGGPRGERLNKESDSDSKEKQDGEIDKDSEQKQDSESNEDSDETSKK